MSSVWILEYRVRPRKNSKWGEWRFMEPESRGYQTSFTSYPAREVVSHEKYEKRAVEYVRKEPGADNA